MRCMVMILVAMKRIARRRLQPISRAMHTVIQTYRDSFKDWLFSSPKNARNSVMQLSSQEAILWDGMIWLKGMTKSNNAVLMRLTLKQRVAKYCSRAML